MQRYLWLLAIVSLLFGAFALTQGEPLSPVATSPSSGADQALPSEEVVAEVELDLLAREPSPGSSVRSPSSKQDSVAENLPVDSADLPKAVAIRGTVFDSDGVALPNARLTLVREGEDESAAFVEGYTALDGSYEMTIRSGRWAATYLGKPGEARNGVLRLGVISVDPSEESVFHDFYLEGGATVSGAIHCTDQDNILIEADVFRNDGGSQLVATAYCETADEEFEEYQAAKEKEGFRRENVPHPPGRGHFKINGLAPGNYTIKAYFDVEKKLAILYSFDLAEGDLELPPIAATTADFFAAKDFSR